MDPLSVLSLTSAIVQLVDFGFKVTKRLTEYTKAGIDEIPKALKTIATQLPLLLDALERVKANLAESRFEEDTRCILRGVVAGCTAQVGKVDKIMDKILSVEGDSKVVRIRKAVKSLGTDEKLAAIEKDLQTYISVLILHHVIDDSIAFPLTTVEDTHFEVPIEQVAPFFERDDLIQSIDLSLKDAKSSQAASPVSVVLYGKVGVGKTQLALEYCHRSHRLGYFKSVFWLNASTPQTLTGSLCNAANAVRRSREGSDFEKMKFTHKFFADRWHPWLLVLDGYNEASYSNVFDLLPKSGCGAYLFTTRASKILMLDNTIEIPKFLTSIEREGLRSQLSNAIEVKNTENALRMISLGADANSSATMGWPAINRAAMNGMEEVVGALLKKGANPKLNACISGEGYSTALYWATRDGHTSIVKMILDHEDKNLSVWEAPGYDSVMFTAAEQGHADVLRLIFSRRDVKSKSKKCQQDALRKAAQNGHTRVVEILLENEIDPTDLPLTLGVKNGHFDTVKAMIKNCSRRGVSISSTHFCKALISLPVSVKNPFMSVEKHIPPEEVESMARYLLELGASPNAATGQKGPLHSAAHEGLKGLVCLLLQSGAQPLLRDGDHDSPLDIAISLGNQDVVSELLKVKIQDATAREEYLSEGFRAAIVRNRCKRDMVLLLLQAGANINRRITDDDTPLIRSINCSEVPTARLLVRYGARADIPDVKGNFPLALAALKGYHLLARDLMQKCDVARAKDSDGSPAICIAAVKGHKEVVHVLLAYKNLPNKYGETALDLAEENGHKEIVELLRDWSIVGR